MKVQAYCDSHIGLVRESNQDAAGCFTESGLFIVADGLGGMAHGELASHTAVEEISECAGNPELPLEQAIARANRAIVEGGLGGDGRPGGTTVVVLRCDLDNARAEWAHVGDSRLYRLRGDELQLLTADHTELGAEFRDRDDIPLDLTHTNLLERALGIEPRVEASCDDGALAVGDLYLLCSDGVSGMIPPSTLTHLLRDVTDLRAGVDRLIDQALERGGRDNATALLVRIDPSTGQQSVAEPVA